MAMYQKNYLSYHPKEFFLYISDEHATQVLFLNYAAASSCWTHDFLANKKLYLQIGSINCQRAKLLTILSIEQAAIEFCLFFNN